jgi:type I restriction enzyme S subunit
MVGQGKTRGLAAILEIQSTINQNLGAICVGPRIRPNFLLFVLHVAYSWIREAARGSNQAALNCEILGEFRIALPTTKEQDDILGLVATETKRIELLADKTQHTINLLKERRAALITAAVTGQIDLREDAA